MNELVRDRGAVVPSTRDSQHLLSTSVHLSTQPSLYLTDSNCVMTHYPHFLGGNIKTKAFANWPDALISMCRTDQEPHTCPAMSSLHHHAAFILLM